MSSGSTAQRRRRRHLGDGPFAKDDSTQQGTVRSLPLYDMRPWWKKDDDRKARQAAAFSGDEGAASAAGPDDFGGTLESVNFVLETGDLRHQRATQCHNDRMRLHRKAGQPFLTPRSEHSKLMAEEESGGSASHRAVAMATRKDLANQESDWMQSKVLQRASKLVVRSYAVLP